MVSLEADGVERGSKRRRLGGHSQSMRRRQEADRLEREDSGERRVQTGWQCGQSRCLSARPREREVRGVVGGELRVSECVRRMVGQAGIGRWGQRQRALGASAR